MNQLNSASLVNLLGFTVGVALYSLLLVMVLSRRKIDRKSFPFYLILATSVLGLLWNIGELFIYIRRDFADTGTFSFFVSAISYSALGFLPSVVVHSAQLKTNKHFWLVGAAYALSVFAAILHFYSFFYSGIAPSNFALKTLTVGSIALIFGIFLTNLRQTLERKMIWASALLIFAVAALHLSGGSEETSFIVELAAHQSSLPIVLVILYQDYRFAFADLFLKRAVSLILLAFLAFGLYVFVAAPLLHYHETHDRNDVQAIGLILTLWIFTALIYPSLHRFAVWFVDKIILRRVDFAELQTEITKEIDKSNSQKEILDLICARLASALTAKSARWTEAEIKYPNVQTEEISPNYVEVIIPTTEKPYLKICLENFIGGRRLLSDETAMLEKIALLTARRLDAMRVNEERFNQEIRRKELAKSAAEAQLKALRAQINPHFLFNVLTTIGYLIHTSPDKAFSTLMKLTGLLRGVLGSTKEFSSLKSEIILIENYLEIEKARFEERLEAEINVPNDLENLQVPSLILQPLVENAVKHGISKRKHGGKIQIFAELQNRSGSVFLILRVKDSGVGFEIEDTHQERIGLSNIKRRIHSHYGSKGSLAIKSTIGKGTTAEISFPVEAETLYEQNTPDYR